LGKDKDEIMCCVVVHFLCGEEGMEAIMATPTSSSYRYNDTSELFSSIRPKSNIRSSYKSRWSTAFLEEEKRQYKRRPLRCEMVLIDINQNEHDDAVAVPATCFNICDGGLYGIVPIGYGVAMGQHYTLRITIGECGPEPGTKQIVFQRGKVVRTELLLGENSVADRVGIGVQFYGHRTSCIPTPSSK